MDLFWISRVNPLVKAKKGKSLATDLDFQINGEAVSDNATYRYGKVGRQMRGRGFESFVCVVVLADSQKKVYT